MKLLQEERNMKSQEGWPKKRKKGSEHPRCSLRDLREEKGWSQRDFSKKLGITRTHLQRLERKTWTRFTMGELMLLARGFEIRLEQLIQRFSGIPQDKELIARSSLSKPFFSVDFSPGAQLASFLKKPAEYFIGPFTLAPKVSLEKGQVPQGNFLFFFILEGNLLLTLSGKEHIFRAGECFSISGGASYELYNPHQLHTLSTLLFCSPSVIEVSKPD